MNGKVGGQILIFFLVAVVSIGVFEIANSDWARLHFLVLVIVATMVGVVVTRPDRRLPLVIDPSVLWCAFLFQFFVLAPSLLTVSKVNFLYVITSSEMVTTLIAFELLLLAFVAGHRTGLAVSLAERLPTFGKSPNKLPGRWIESAILISALLGCLWYLRYVGGVAARMETAYGRVSRPALFNIAFLMLITGTLLMAWRLASATQRKRFEVGAFLALLVLEVPFFGILLGARKRLFFLFVGLATVWLLTRGKRRLPVARLSVVGAILLAYFAVWGAIRDRPLAALGFEDSRPGVEYTPSAETGYVRGVAAPFLTSCLVMSIFPEREPFRYGGTMLVTVFGFIPRAVWEDKPVGLGKELTRYSQGFHYKEESGHSVTPTVLGELYANLGWLGVVIGGYVAGLICRMMAAYALVGTDKDGIQQNPGRVLIVAVFLAGLVEVRAGPSKMLAFYALAGIPLIVALSFFQLDYRVSERVSEQPAPSP